jgi:hypothetical protein
MTAIAALLVLALLSGCSTRQEVADSAALPARDPEEITGIVRVVGSAPVNVQTVLQPPTGTGLRLIGPLAAELQRLAGIEVAVRGTISASPDPIVPRQLEAADYRIVAVDGRPAVMGEIISITGSSAVLRQADGAEVRLEAIPPGFRVGQKVWVQGPETLVVQTYGTIRP